MNPTLATLVYALKDGQVLLLKRRKRPYAGSWVAPGGKLDPFEAPAACAVRELHEETGLAARRILLRGVVREVSPAPSWQWLLYIYVVTEFEGNLIPVSPEGDLQWWRIEDVPALTLPEADRIFFPAVIDLSRPAYEARFQYDAEERLVSTIEYCGELHATRTLRC
jgi:8-oxo-dGTP diphosphatase